MFGGKETRFELVENEVVKGAAIFIYVDTQTGVQYLELDRGVSVLQDAEGKPLLYNKYKPK